jgi:hypothetical protein
MRRAYFSARNRRKPMIVRGDARQIPLRDESVQCVVTSPPYFQLRDYSCGVREIGNEDTPEEYVGALLEAFREVRRVLRNDGVLWLVLGDASWGTTPRQRALKHPVLKPKDRIGLPWHVALALQADGWYLRADVIWAKPNPMPDPVGGRPSRSHEYIFLLSKSRNYYYDADAIAEPTVSDHPSANRFIGRHDQRHGHRGTSTCWNDIGGRRNRRDVWQFKSDKDRRDPLRSLSNCARAALRAGWLAAGRFGLGSFRWHRDGWRSVRAAITTLGRRRIVGGICDARPPAYRTGRPAVLNAFPAAQRPFLRPAKRAARYWETWIVARGRSLAAKPLESACASRWGLIAADCSEIRASMALLASVRGRR